MICKPSEARRIVHVPTPKGQTITIPGPTGPLEGVLINVDLPQRAGIAVVCHPHPLYGGTMNNKVVVSVAKAFADLGFAVIRFNYRGVGHSAGVYDSGVGETTDAVTAIDWLRRLDDHGPLWIAGFSFGTYVGLRAAEQRPPAGLISIAPAVNLFNFQEAQPPSCPWLVIHGDHDELVPVNDVLNWVSSLPERPMLLRVKGASHFFHGRLNDIKSAVTHFVKDANNRIN